MLSSRPMCCRIRSTPGSIFPACRWRSHRLRASIRSCRACRRLAIRLRSRFGRCRSSPRRCVPCCPIFRCRDDWCPSRSSRKYCRRAASRSTLSTSRRVTPLRLPLHLRRRSTVWRSPRLRPIRLPPLCGRRTMCCVMPCRWEIRRNVFIGCP